MNPIDRVLDALSAYGHQPRQRGEHHQARCPVHGGDDFDSLTITEGADGRVLLTCHSRGCAYTDIMQELGLEASDGFMPRTVCVQGVEVPMRRAPADTPTGDPDVVYDYTDEKGRLLFQVLRYRKPDGGKTFRQRQKGTNGEEWLWNLKGVTRVLYRLPDVRRAVAEKQIIYLVEGEKDVETLRALGLTGTCAPGGACEKPRSWLPQYTEALRGAEVVILPDNDEVGRKHAEIASEALQDVVRRCRVVTLPDLPEKGDVSDWVAAGGTADDLRALVKTPRIHVMTFEELVELKVPPREAFVEPWFARQDLMMVYAWRGVGKTWFSLGLACALASGSRFIKWDVPKPRGVLYVDGEMAVSSLQERIARISAPMREITAPLHIITPDVQDVDLRLLSTREGQGDIEDVLEATPGIDVVIFDNLSCLYGGDENDSAAFQLMKEFLLRLRRHGYTSCLVHHAAKGGQQRGHSSKEDSLNVTIKLEHPKSYRVTDDARFKVVFEKARDVRGSQIDDVEVSLVDTRNNALEFGEILDRKLSRLREVVELVDREGLSQAAAAKQCGVDRSTISRWLAEAAEMGLRDG